MQRFSIYLFIQDAVHVSDGSSVHHKELKTAHTVSAICQTIPAASLARLATGSSNGLTNA